MQLLFINFLKFFLLILVLWIFVWGFYFLAVSLFLCLRVFFLLILNIFKETTYQKSKLNFNSKRYDSIFNTPALLYSTVVISGGLISPLLSVLSNRLKYSSLPLVIGPILFLLYFWLTVWFYFSKIKKDKDKIIGVVKNHKKFIKTTALPLGLISIVVPILSVINMFADQSIKSEIIGIFSSIKLSNSDVTSVIILILMTLIYEGISYLLANFIEHLYETEGAYSFYFKELFILIKKLI